MGVFHGKDLFSPRYSTVEIIDENQSLHYFKVRRHYSGYFPCKIRNKMYVVYLDPSAICTYTTKQSRSWQKYLFFASSAIPLSNEIPILAKWLRDNHMHKISKIDMKIIEELAATEAKDIHDGTEFKGHDLDVMCQELNKGDSTPDADLQLISYLKSLPTTKIVTRAGPINDLLHKNVKTLSPSYLGDVCESYHKSATLSKKAINYPIEGKTSLTKLVGVISVVALILGVVVYANESGLLTGFDGILPDSNAVDYSFNAISAKYPEPIDLYCAVDSGILEKSKMPKIMQASIDGYADEAGAYGYDVCAAISTQPPPKQESILDVFPAAPELPDFPTGDTTTAAETTPTGDDPNKIDIIPGIDTPDLSDFIPGLPDPIETPPAADPEPVIPTGDLVEIEPGIFVPSDTIIVETPITIPAPDDPGTYTITYPADEILNDSAFAEPQKHPWYPFPNITHHREPFPTYQESGITDPYLYAALYTSYYENVTYPTSTKIFTGNISDYFNSQELGFNPIDPIKPITNSTYNINGTT